MDCRTFQKHLEDYLEGGLDYSGRFGIERHSQQCFLCGKEMASALELRKKAREIRRVSAPGDFESAVLDRIQKDERHLSYKRLRWAWMYREEWPLRRAFAAGVFGFMLLAIGAVYFVRWPVPLSLDPESSVPRVFTQESIGLQSGETGTGPEFPISRVDSKTQVAFDEPALLPLFDTYSSDENYVLEWVEPADSEFKEYMVPGPDNRQMIMRLPETIRMRYSHPSEDYFIQYVSH